MNSVVVKKSIASANMSAPELYAARAAGYEPIAVVIGVAAVSMGSRGFGRSIRAIFVRGEMQAVSQTATEARKKALARAMEDAEALGADLVLVRDWDTRDLAEIVEITCNATALKRVGDFMPMPIANATS